MNALLLTACAAPVPLPTPTGELPVGQTTLHLVDRDRPEPMTPSDDVREVTLHVFYPAASSGETEPTEYVPALKSLRPALDHRTERLFRHVQRHAVLDAPAATEPEVFPVVVLSHGNDRLGLESTFLIEELASHGYAVVVIEHPYDARAVVLSDGQVVSYAGDAWPPLPPPPEDGEPDPDTDYARFYRERVEVRAEDARFVLDRLEVEDPLAALGEGTRLDLERVAFVGHSVGGVAAGTFCQSDTRAAGCVNLDGDFGDGPFYLQEDGAAFDAPYLMLTKPFWPSDEQLASWGLTREAWVAQLDAQRDATFGKVTGGSWRVVLDGVSHDSFTDEPFVLASLQGEDPAPYERHLELIRAYVLAFLDRSLQGEPTSLLDEPPPEGVTVERWPSGGR